MPYIAKEKRPQFEPFIQNLVALINALPENERDGALNYCVTVMLKRIYPPKYFNYNRAIGVLGCIRAEYYRRVVGLYEDKKIEENGDVE